MVIEVDFDSDTALPFKTWCQDEGEFEYKQQVLHYKFNVSVMFVSLLKYRLLHQYPLVPDF